MPAAIAFSFQASIRPAGLQPQGHIAGTSAGDENESLCGRLAQGRHLGTNLNLLGVGASSRVFGNRQKSQPR
jgi:hypothetical protein